SPAAEPDQAGPCDLAGRDQGCAGSGQRSGRRQADVRQVPAVRPARPMSTVAAIDPRHAAGQRLRERVFRGATFLAALLVLALLGGVALSLVVGSWPALARFRLGFLTREIWNPVTDQFGALAPVYGTLVTSLLALALAIPVSLGIAIFL